MLSIAIKYIGRLTRSAYWSRCWSCWEVEEQWIHQWKPTIYQSRHASTHCEVQQHLSPLVLRGEWNQCRTVAEMEIYMRRTITLHLVVGDHVGFHSVYINMDEGMNIVFWASFTYHFWGIQMKYQLNWINWINWINDLIIF